MRKIKIVCVLLCIVMIMYVAFGFLYRGTISNEYQSCQEMEINSDILSQQKITKPILCSVLEDSYFENEQGAGFNSRYIAVDFFEGLSWKKAYCLFRLADAYNIDIENMSVKLSDVVDNMINSINYDEITIPEIYELLILDEGYGIGIDRTEILLRLESYYSATDGLYKFSESVSEELQIEATFFAILIYDKLEQEVPHKNEIINALKNLNSTNDLFSEDYCPEFWILAMNGLGICEFEDDFIREYETYLDKKEKSYREYLKTNTNIDSIELFYSYYCLLAAEIVDVKVDVYINTIKSMIEYIDFADILSSKEITDAAIWLEKNDSWGIYIFGTIQEQVNTYVLDNFETGFIGNFEEKIETNPMDTYYGICLSDLCDFKYNKNKINKQMDEWLQGHLNREEPNRYLFLFFDLLVSEKTEYKLSKVQIKKIRNICKEYFEGCKNMDFSDDENIKCFMEETLFVIEICRLIDSDVSKEEKSVVLSVLNEIVNEELITDTSYISECRLIVDILGEDIVIRNEDITCRNLLSNGGYASIIGEGLENIVSTGKMARVDDYKAYLEKKH